MAIKICTACGYEGQAVRAPSDAGGEEESFVVGVLNKLIFVMTFMPIKVNFIVRMFKRGSAKHCPNCGLPFMVKLTSDAGWLAQRKNDIKAGIRFDAPEAPVVGFGREIILPSNEPPPPKYVAPPVPDNLPHLDTMLETAKQNDAAPAAPEKATEAPSAPPPPKKPSNPDEW